MPYIIKHDKNRAILVSLVLVVIIALSIFIPQAITANSWTSSSSSFSTPVGSGSNWLTEWNYRKMITVAGSRDGAQTNYQMKLTINRSTGADSGSNVYVGTNCASDYRDIRFSRADGTTLLDYWIESSDSSKATVWIEFDSIPAYPNNGSFYLYYGYASANAASSGANTFLLFDDFLGTAISSIWTKSGSPSVSGGILTLSGSTCGIKSKTAYGYRRFRALINFPSDTHAGYRNWAGFKDNFNQSGEEATHFAPVGGSPTSMCSQNYLSAWDSVIRGNGYVDAYKTFQIDRLGSSSIKYYISDSLLRSTAIQIPTSALHVMFMCGNAATTNYNQPFYVHWVFIANLTANEPTWGTWGNEETNPSPTVTNVEGDSSVTGTTKIPVIPPNVLLMVIIACVVALVIFLWLRFLQWRTRKRDELFERVCKAIKDDYKPPPNAPRFEEAYQWALHQYLRTEFPKEDPELEKRIEGEGGRPDITIKHIAIEVKGPTGAKELDNLIEKCWKYGKHYPKLIFVLFAPEYSQSKFEEVKNEIRKRYSELDTRFIPIIPK